MPTFWCSKQRLTSSSGLQPQLASHLDICHARWSGSLHAPAGHRRSVVMCANVSESSRALLVLVSNGASICAHQYLLTQKHTLELRQVHVLLASRPCTHWSQCVQCKPSTADLSLRQLLLTGVSLKAQCVTNALQSLVIRGSCSPLQRSVTQLQTATRCESGLQDQAAACLTSCSQHKGRKRGKLTCIPLFSQCQQS